MISMQDFWQRAKAEIIAHKPVMFCTIVAKRGSAPRGVGAHMLVLSDGTTVDTIGGGILEYETKAAALNNSRQQQSGLIQFSLGNNDAAKDGMICGGQLSVLMLYLTAEHLPQIDKILCFLEQNKPMLIAVKWRKGIFSFNVSDDCNFVDLQGKKTLLLLKKPADSDNGAYWEIIQQRPTVYLFGGGYVAQEVAKLLPALEFEYYLIEERAEFAQASLFPHAKRRIICDYAEFERFVQIKQSDFAVIATSGHKSDTLLLDKLLKLNLAYLGAIGSRHKKAIVSKYLLEQGYTSEVINSIVLPIGLDIGAQTPAEIAVSIAAQLIQARVN